MKSTIDKSEKIEPPLCVENGILVFAGTALCDISDSVRKQRKIRIKKLSAIKRK